MGAAPILTILKNGETIKSQSLEGECILGRAEGCVIRLDDRAISRQHALLRVVAGGVQIEKKSEVAPLSVNGAECTRALVKEGDVISIGPYLLKLSMSGSTSSDSKAANTAPSAPLELAAPSADIPVVEAAASTAEVNSLEAPEADGSAAVAEALEPSSPELAPEFSMNAVSQDHAGPVDLGEISIDEDAKTKVLSIAKVSARLVLPPGSANVTEFQIEKDEISIGRGKDCDIVLDDKKSSRKHAIIRRQGVNFSIKDLESANGTYVNDEKITERELSGDDILKIGNVEFRFLVLSSDYAENQDKFMPVPEEPAADDAIGFSQSDPQGFEAPQSSDAMAMPQPGLDVNPGVSGLAGIAGASAGKTSLLEKYRALPPRRKIIWSIVILAGLYFVFFDDEAPKAPPKKPAAIVAKDTKDKAPATFESLTPEQKKFVESQHALAFDYYKNRDYDKALFEVEKIFALIPDYKDSREIERYAKEGKRKLEALEDEKRKKEADDKLKLQIATLVDQAKGLMDKKDYAGAGEVFPQILALDPDNQQVADWRRLVDKFDEEKRIKDQEKSVQDQINIRAWDLFREGMAFKKKAKYHEAIDDFKRVADIGATDKKAEKSATAEIKATQALIAQLRDPVLADAKQAEDNQEYPKAYGLYRKSTEIDPLYPAGYAGMDRIRGILHERAKAIYIDAVLADSYSDFETAKKKYQECKDVAPKDDIYYERAERKLATFFKAREEQPQ